MNKFVDICKMFMIVMLSILFGMEMLMVIVGGSITSLGLVSFICLFALLVDYMLRLFGFIDKHD